MSITTVKGSVWSAEQNNQAVNVKEYGAVGDGVTDDSVAIKNAIDSGRPVELVDDGIYLIATPMTISGDIALYCRDSSVITGYNGTGISFSGSSILLDGVKVRNFYDGTDQNPTNYTTTFIAVSTGTTIDKITVTDCEFTNCRSVIRAASAISDITPDTTINVNNVTITGNKTDGCPVAFTFRCLYNNVKIHNNSCFNSIGAGRAVTVFGFYLDGQGKGNSNYDLIGDVICTNNYFNTIVNRTTTGDSTPGNSYETHALQVSGLRAIINNNAVVDCTGNNYDCEAIYTKCRYVQINDNILINAGGSEGAINIKGNSEDGDPSNTSPYGGYSIVNRNLISFTFDSYNNNGTIVNFETRGIHNAAPSWAEVKDNIIIGTNQVPIVMNGNEGATANRATKVIGNIAYQISGNSMISYRGAFQDMECKENFCTEVTTDGGSFYMIDLLSVANRGIEHKNTVITGNTLFLGDATANESGYRHSFVRVDTENYDFTGLVINNNYINIQNTAASARPIDLTDQVAATGVIHDIEVKGNKFIGGNFASGPINFSVTPQTYDIDVVFDWQSTANTAQNAALFYVADDKIIDANMRVVSSRIDVTGQVQRDISDFLGNAATGTLSIIDNTAQALVGNATGINVTFATLADYLRVRISGEDFQTWNHNIHFTCVCR